MQLTEAQVKKYQVIYEAHFGEEISLEDATAQAQKLFSFVHTVYGEIRRPEVQALLRYVLEEERVQKEKSEADKEQKVGCSPSGSAVI